MNGNYQQQIVQMLQGMPHRPAPKPQPMPKPAATMPRAPVVQPGPMPMKPPVKRGF